MLKQITLKTKKSLCCFFLVFVVSLMPGTNDLSAQKKLVTSPYESDWTEISSIISGINGTYTSPVDDGGNTKYSNGALLGNGELGVVTGGDWHTMKLYVGKNAFWSGLSSTSDATPISLNVGSISIKSIGANGANSNYNVTQNILEGTVNTSLTIDSKAVQMKTWTSDSKNLIITELSTNSGQNVSIQVNLNVTGNQPGMVLTAGLSGTLLWVEKDTKTTNVPFYCKAVMATKIFGADITPSTNNINASSATFTLIPGIPVFIVTNVESVKDMASPKSTVEDYMNGLTTIDITNLYTEHVGWWKEFWLKSYISLSDIALQKYWYGHLYAIACCQRATSEAATGLFGNFVTTDSPSWYNDLKMNYNAENPFYGIFSSNHSDLIKPYVTAITNYAVLGRKRVATRSNLISADVRGKMPVGCRGMQFGGGITGFGTEECESGDFSMPSIATFATVPIVWYWRYTQDEVYLKDKAYPLILECANFYEDYIGAKDATGKYNVYGGVHETGPWEATYWFAKNSIMDVGAVKYIFKSIIDASKVLGVNADRLAKWQDIIDNISYPVETYKGVNYVGEDAVHSISYDIHHCGAPLFWTSWDNISYSTDSLLLARVRNTLVLINKWTIGNNFGMSPVIGARAFYNPAYLVNIIKSQPLRNNLTVSQDGGGIETSGIVEAIDNMLLQSHDGVIRFFPNWAPALKASFKRLRTYGAFLVDGTYNGDSIQSISVFSEAGKICSVQKPWPTKNLKIRIAGGEDVLATQNGNVYTFNTIQGTTYELYSDEMISGTPKIVDFNISIFPNPSSGQMNVKSDAIIEEICITNIDGQVIMLKQPKSIETSFIFNENSVAPGIYFAKIKTLKGVSTHKLLFQ